MPLTVLYAARKETHLSIHLLAAVTVIGIGLYQDISPTEWFIIILCIGFVFVAELFNTVIEKTIDYLKPEQQPKSQNH